MKQEGSLTVEPATNAHICLGQRLRRMGKVTTGPLRGVWCKAGATRHFQEDAIRTRPPLCEYTWPAPL